MTKYKYLLAALGIAAFLLIAPPMPGRCDPASPDDLAMKEVAGRLKQAYEFDVKEILTPLEEQEKEKTENLAPEDILKKYALISPELLTHLGNIGGLDFDILLDAQDWDKSYRYAIDEPKKEKGAYTVAVHLDKGDEKSTVTWYFIKQDSRWVITDARYERSGGTEQEAPFTLLSLKEGD